MSDTMDFTKQSKSKYSLLDTLWFKVLAFLAIAFILFFVIVVLWGATYLPDTELRFPNTKTVANSEDQLIANLPTVDRVRVETADDPWFGDANAPIVIVEFADFQCPYCKESILPLKRLLATSSVPMKVIYRDFPVYDVHPFSLQAAQAGECAQDQNSFKEFHDMLFAHQDALSVAQLTQYVRVLGMDDIAFETCLRSGKYQKEVVDDLQEGFRLGVEGTPTWFINGYRIPGVLNEDLFQQIIQEIMAQ